jgi:Holliday junction DNA helicase RuvA
METTMISAVNGNVVWVGDDRLHLQVQSILLELLIPASDAPVLGGAVGQALTLHTIFYLEGDAGGGFIEPRLIGFLRNEDRRFFEKFITVKGIGPKKALRALVQPAGEIAAAIESKDTRALCQLPAIGKRMAEQIIAELSGKVQEFVSTGIADPRLTVVRRSRPGIEEDALATLMVLGERRTDAEDLLERVRSTHPDLASADAIVREMLRLRSAR